MFSQPELAPLSRLLADTGVSDLVVNGHDHAAVLIGGKWQTVESGFEDEAALAQAARILIGLGNRQLDQAHPFANADILGKLRVHALLASSIASKTHLSIRVHANRKLALEQLCEFGMVNRNQLQTLRKILHEGDSFIVSGSAGAGKTTLLRAMLSELSGERIICIEDVCELNLTSSDCVSLLSRSANVEGRGEIGLQQLLIESLRMRPDRIVIGELRSQELLTLLQATNTGHRTAATLHANSSSEVIERLLSIAIAQGLPASSLERLIRSSIKWFIHITSVDGRRTIEIRRNHE